MPIAPDASSWLGEFVSPVPVRYLALPLRARARKATAAATAASLPPSSLWNLTKIRWAEARARFASDFAARTYATVEELCADPAVEIVYVATPHQHHRGHAMLAAELGKHLVQWELLPLNVDPRQRHELGLRDLEDRPTGRGGLGDHLEGRSFELAPHFLEELLLGRAGNDG